VTISTQPKNRRHPDMERPFSGPLRPEAIGRGRLPPPLFCLTCRAPSLDVRWRPLEDRLEAARSNNRFADRRIAQLEAQLTERAPAR